MSWKYINVVYWCLYLLCQVSLVQCQLTLVTRNVIDSFRIGEGSCNENASICASTEAFCQLPTGLCQCKDTSPHFRNPSIELSGSAFRYGSSYGCVIQQLIVHQRIGEERCRIIPYQVIPYHQNGILKQFNQTGGYQSCSFIRAEVKYPDSNTWQEISWLNESYVTVIMTHNQLHFKFAKSVPELQGVIIEITLNCGKIVTEGTQYVQECLQAKILGTWTLADTNSTTTVPSTTTKRTTTKSPMSDPSNATSTTTIAPKRNNTNKLSVSDDSPSGGIIAVAVIIPLVVIVLIIVIAWFILTRRKRKRGSHSSNIKADVLANPHHETGQVNNGQMSEYAQPQVNSAAGDVYSVVNKPNNNGYRVPKAKRSIDPNELNYMAPENLDLDFDADKTESSEPTEYAKIAGVLRGGED